MWEALAAYAVIMGLWLMLLMLPPEDDAERDARFERFKEWFR